MPPFADWSGGAIEAPHPANKELSGDIQGLQGASRGCALADLGSVIWRRSKRPFVRGATQWGP